MNKYNQKEYMAIHTWLRSNFGKASCCENKECTKIYKKFEYALIKGKKYEKNRDNFMQLCRSCHKKYDITEETRRKYRDKKLGISMPQNIRDKISMHHKKSGLNKKVVLQFSNSNEFIKKWFSISEAAEYYGISKTAISNCLNKRAITSNNYIWKYDKQ